MKLSVLGHHQKNCNGDQWSEHVAALVATTTVIVSLINKLFSHIVFVDFKCIFEAYHCCKVSIQNLQNFSKNQG